MKIKILPVFLSAVFTGFALYSHAQANQQLSNLTSPTAVNQSLLPDISNARTLGTGTMQWRNLYLGTGLYLNGSLTMHRSGSNNFFVGVSAGNTALTGNSNTGTGINALKMLTSGNSNTANGLNALTANTTGNFSTATGVDALEHNTTGSWNTAYGTTTLHWNTTGNFNTATGFGALQYNTGGSNTANGSQALFNNTTGNFNTASGDSALRQNTTGGSNTAMGYAALNHNTTGSNNIALGYGADVTSGGLSNATAIGYNAKVAQSNSLVLGGTGANAVKVGIGTTTPGYTLDVAGTINVNALNLNRTIIMHAPGTNNFFVGPSAGNTAVKGNNNSATGSNALHSVTSGSGNTANGAYALYSDTMGIFNTAIGDHALYSNTGKFQLWFTSGVAVFDSNVIGSSNTAIGYKALYSNTLGEQNTATGVYALYSNTDGTYNTANGVDALSNTTGYRNTALGSFAGDNVTTGVTNTFIGSDADAGSGDITNAIALGYYTTVNASNTVQIGNSYVTSIGGYVNWSNVSDGRIKKNIRNNVPGLAFINKLHPITYNLDLEAADRIIQSPAHKTKDGKTIAPAQQDIAARKAKEQVVYTGFVAQEVEKAAKELNYDFSGVDAAKNDKDLYGLRYAEFVVPLIKAVQELSKQVEDLQKQVEELKGGKTANTTSTAAAQSATDLTLSSASLDNYPNPFAGATTIRYNLPAGFRAAQIVITDNNGKAIKQVPLNTAGNGTVNIDASTLGSGTYNYSLVVDGKVIMSKKMTIAH